MDTLKINAKILREFCENHKKKIRESFVEFLRKFLKIFMKTLKNIFYLEENFK